MTIRALLISLLFHITPALLLVEFPFEPYTTVLSKKPDIIKNEPIEVVEVQKGEVNNYDYEKVISSHLWRCFKNVFTQTEVKFNILVLVSINKYGELKNFKVLQAPAKIEALIERTIKASSPFPPPPFKLSINHPLIHFLIPIQLN